MRQAWTKKMLENIYNNLDEAFFSFDTIQNKVLYASSAHQTIFGYPQEAFCTNPQLWYQCITAEDKLIVDAGYLVLLAGKKYQHQIRILRADGQLRWIEAKVSPTLDSNGKLIRVEGIISDITEPKKEENRLKLLEAIILKAKDAVVVAQAGQADTTEPRIIFVNHAFTVMTGYTRKEVMGKTLGILEGPKTDKTGLKRIKRAISKEKSCEIEMVSYKKDDEEFWSNISISPVSDTEGNNAHWIAIIRDITEIKNQEQEIEKAIINAHENEKNLIGMELHDNVNQILTASIIALSQPKELSAKDAVWVSQAIGYIQTSIDEIQKLSHLLTPNILRGDTLQESFEVLFKNINADGRWCINLHFGQLDIMSIQSDIQLNLYRILQEQLNNIFKYSNATSIEVTVVLAGDKISMRIFDNGDGFDTKKTTSGIGLSNIKRRAESFSGSFAIHSSPGNGCELVVEIPV